MQAVRSYSGSARQWRRTPLAKRKRRSKRSTVSSVASQKRFSRPRYREDCPVFKDLTFDAVYQPSSKDLLVGGDWYDAFPLSNGTLAVSVGDVNGHGLEAAVLMSKLRQSFRAVAMRAAQFQNRDPGSIISSVEDMMLMENPDFIASVFFCVLDPQRRTLEFSNAGHPPALLQRSDGSIEEALAMATHCSACLQL